MRACCGRGCVHACTLYCRSPSRSFLFYRYVMMFVDDHNPFQKYPARYYGRQEEMGPPVDRNGPRKAYRSYYAQQKANKASEDTRNEGTPNEDTPNEDTPTIV